MKRVDFGRKPELLHQPRLSDDLQLGATDLQERRMDDADTIRGRLHVLLVRSREESRLACKK
jgi:hypothetical protein